jgi:preprotein translocase subunit SecA
VGTTSIEKSEYLAELLKRKGIPHEVLNAKQHEREANIIQDAGKDAAVTIATNMAGRGTDIKLGPGIADVGGLHVIGTERHESRRIDNQLRGRAGRQGDPGSSRFFVSFGDDIMKRFAPEWVPGMMQKLGMTEDMPLESRMVTRAIEQAQGKVEGHNFDIRKRLVEFDDVINEHRKQIYTQRDMILQGVDTRANVIDHMLLPEIERIIKGVSTTDYDSLELMHAELGEILPPTDMPTLEEMQELGDELCDEMLDRAEDRYEAIEAAIGDENVRKVEHWLILEAIDTHWREHLTAIEELRQSIGLQAYAQVDPLVAFKREGHDMYQQLVANIQRQVARTVFKVRIVQQDGQAGPPPTAAPVALSTNGTEPDSSETNGAAPSGKKATAVLAKPSGPSKYQIRTLGCGQAGPIGKCSNAA